MTQTSSNASPVLSTATSKVFAKLAKDARGSLPVGVHVVDEVVAVRVHGTLTVSEDETYVATTSVPLKAALALFSHYAGFTGKHAQAALVRAMHEAVTGDYKSDEVLMAQVASVDAALKCVDQVQKACANLPTKTRKGKVSFKPA